MGSDTISDTYRRDARLYSGLDVSTSAPSISGAAFPLTSCRIASSISGSGAEPALSAGAVEGESVVAAALAVFERAVEAVAVADADFVAAADVAVFRVRVAVVLAAPEPALASAFFAEAAAPADLVDAERVVFFAAGAGASSAGPVARAAASDFFRGVLAGVAPAVLLVLSFFFGTLEAAVLLAALAGFAAVDASRSGADGVRMGMPVMHRAHRPKRCGLKPREAILRFGLYSCCNRTRPRPLVGFCSESREGSCCCKGIVDPLYTYMLVVNKGLHASDAPFPCPFRVVFARN